MQLRSENESEKENTSQVVNEKRQYFINDEKFRLLRQYQQEIFEVTEVSPALRKLVNELISVENLEKVKTKFINQWSHES